MRLPVFLAFILSSQFIISQTNFNVFHEQVGTETIIYANNQEYCPVSVELDLELINLKSSKGDSTTFIVPAQSMKFRLTTLSFDMSKLKPGNTKTNFTYKSNFYFGDYSLSENLEEYVYQLPFEKLSSSRIVQGYNGTFSHRDKYLLDFEMLIGTPVHAARDGVVISIVDINERNCSTKNCIKYNNYLLLHHADGTFSEYVHLKKKGVKVKVGDKVKKGQLIAESGNTGWSTGPHLHFSVFRQVLEKRITLKTKFLVGDGNSQTYLEEGETYSRMY